MADNFDPKEFEGMFKIFLDRFMKNYDRRYSGSSKTFQDFLDKMKDGTDDLDKNSVAHIRIMDALKNLDKQFDRTSTTQRVYGDTHIKLNGILHSHLGAYGKLGATVVELSRALGGLRGTLLAFGAGITTLAIEQFAFVAKTIKNTSQNGTYSVFARAETPGKNVANVIGSSAEQLGITISSLMEITQEYGAAIDYYGIESFKRLAKSQQSAMANYGLSSQETDKLLAAMLESQRIAGITNRLDESYRNKLASDQATNIQEIARATKQSAESVQKKMEEAAKSPGFQTALAGSKLSDEQKGQVLKNYQAALATVPDSLKPVIDNMFQNRLSGLSYAMDEQYRQLLPDQGLISNLNKVVEAGASGNLNSSNYQEVLNSTLSKTAGQMNKNTDLILAKALNNPALVNAYSGLQEFATRYQSEKERPFAEKESDNRLMAAQAAISNAMQNLKGTFEGAFFKGLGDTGTAQGLADSISKFAKSIGEMLSKNQKLIEQILEKLPGVLEEILIFTNWILTKHPFTGIVGALGVLIAPVTIIKGLAQLIGKGLLIAKVGWFEGLAKMSEVGGILSRLGIVGKMFAGTLGVLGALAKRFVVFGLIIGAIEGVWTVVKEIYEGKNVLTAIWDGFKAFANGVVGDIQSLALYMTDRLLGTHLKESFDQFNLDAFLGDLKNNMTDWISHAWRGLKDALYYLFHPGELFSKASGINKLESDQTEFEDSLNSGKGPKEVMDKHRAALKDADDYINKFGRDAFIKYAEGSDNGSIRNYGAMAKSGGSLLDRYNKSQTNLAIDAQNINRTKVQGSIEKPQKVTIVEAPATNTKQADIQDSNTIDQPTANTDATESTQLLMKTLQNIPMSDALMPVFSQMQDTLQGILATLGKHRSDSMLRDS